MCLFTVVIQPYEAEADNEYVIRGNSVVMKCEIPSFVADFVSVTMWQDSEGNNFYPSNDYGNKLLVSVKCGWFSFVPFSSPKSVLSLFNRLTQDGYPLALQLIMFLFL